MEGSTEQDKPTEPAQSETPSAPSKADPPQKTPQQVDPLGTSLQELTVGFGPVRYRFRRTGKIRPRVSALNALGADKLNERREQIRVEREESDAALAKLVGVALQP